MVFGLISSHAGLEIEPSQVVQETGWGVNAISMPESLNSKNTEEKWRE